MTEKVGSDELPDKLDYHYQKSPSYRTIHVDGARGGPTGRRHLSITFYNERAALPRRTSRAISKGDESGGSLGPEEIEDSLGGVVRQLEITAMLDLNAARELLVWLRGQVGVLESLFEVPESQRVGDPVQLIEGTDGNQTT